MHQYITDCAFAVQGLIGLIGHDSEQLAELGETQKTALAKEEYFDLAFLQREMHPAANYWYGRYYEAAAQRAEIDKEIAFLEGQILDKQHSLGALAGALLQISKQGISSVRGRPDNCPAGRQVRGIDLKWLIWAGRNQTQHYEETKKIEKSTVDVFDKLNGHAETSAFLDPKAGSNLAFDVVSILGWANYAQYEQDMVSLLG